MKALEAQYQHPTAVERVNLEFHGAEAQGTEPQGGGDGAMCPAIQAIALLQEKWVLFIVRALLGGAKGFNELRREVGGCNPSTLSERLDTLEKRGIITKTVCSTMPPRTSYELTVAGFALQNVILEIDAWSRQHLKLAS